MFEKEIHSVSIRRSTSRHQRTQIASTPIIEPLECRKMLTIAGYGPYFGESAHELHDQEILAKQSKKSVTTSTAHPFNNLVVIHGNRFNRRGGGGKQVTYLPVPGAYAPQQVRTAYGVSALPVTNEGQGMTIGIVDELDDPNITADANAFSTQYSLPQFNSGGTNPTLTVYKDTATGTIASASGTGVAGETSLDVEWAHSIAPYANILLVEVAATGNVANNFAQLLQGVNYAAQKGDQAISLSYGYAESSIGATNVVNQNATYLASGSEAYNTAVTVSSGDGSSPLFPATSPNVIAVGGSSLYLASAKGSYSFETAWGGLQNDGAGGGGLSTNFAAPTYQSTNGVSYAKRAIPDVALIADPVTGVSVYDSLDETTSVPSPWEQIGGTSLAAPVFAGMISLAQQTRVAAGKAILNSVQIDTAIYSSYNSSSYSTYFHDITLGNNNNSSSTTSQNVTGYSAATGYDLATGVGSPIANTFLLYLASL